MITKKLITLAILVSLSLQDCLSEAKLKELGLTPLTEATEVKIAISCESFYTDVTQNTCIDLDQLGTVVSQKAEKFATTFADEMYEVFSEIDFLIDSFLNFNTEIQTKNTVKGSQVSTSLKAKFTAANEWIDSYNFYFEQISQEINTCNKAQQANIYGAYCYFSSDGASTHLPNQKVSTCPASKTHNNGSQPNRLLGAGASEGGRISHGTDPYNFRMLETSTNEIQIKINFESVDALILDCMNSIKSICVMFYMADAVASANGGSFPQTLKNKCIEDSKTCISTPNKITHHTTQDAKCTKEIILSVFGNWIGSFNNLMLDTETKDKLKFKGGGSPTSRETLFEKFESFGPGEAKIINKTLKERRDDLVGVTPTPTSKVSSSSQTRRILAEIGQILFSSSAGEDAENGADTRKYGLDSQITFYNSQRLMVMLTFFQVLGLLF